MRAIDNERLAVLETLRDVKIAPISHQLAFTFVPCHSVKLGPVLILRIQISDHLLDNACLQDVRYVDLLCKLSDEG
jgi:hypothetical protein